MNKNMVFAGMVFGAFIAVTAILGVGITGYAVIIGGDTINIGETIAEDTIIPLTMPNNITSFTFNGLYQGSGHTTIYLVGANESWHITSYEAPPTAVNTTFLLAAGGTVITLNEDTGINYTHPFINECDETCNESMTGPFYLQINMDGGSTTVTSISYTTETIFTEPETPPPVNETINITPPTPPTRENPPTECTSNSDCDTGFMCEAQYCISTTGHLNITDHTGRLVALFDKTGRVLLAGDIIEEAAGVPPANAFRIQNRWSDIAWITADGDFYVTGTLHEDADSIPLVGPDNFVIRNPEQDVCVVQGATGDFYTVKNVVANALP